MMISSWTPPELPFPAEKTGWLVAVQQFFASRDGVLTSIECPVMNKVRAQLIRKRLRAEGMEAVLVSVAEYRRRLIARMLAE